MDRMEMLIGAMQYVKTVNSERGFKVMMMGLRLKARSNCTEQFILIDMQCSSNIDQPFNEFNYRL